MVICFEEKDRQTIEESFGSIIEFKRKLYGITLFERKLVKVINEAWDNVKEVVMQLIECFKRTVVPLFSDAITRWKDLFDDLYDGKFDGYIEPRERYHIVKHICKSGYYDLQTYEKRIRAMSSIRYHCRSDC